MNEYSTEVSKPVKKPIPIYKLLPLTFLISVITSLIFLKILIPSSVIRNEIPGLLKACEAQLPRHLNCEIEIRAVPMETPNEILR